MENLVIVIADLLVAGTESAATTIRWALIYLLHNPEIQKRCFREIQENLGLSRRPSMKDKTNLTYVEATIMEILRRADVIPTALPHTVPHDVQFRGYTFPTGVPVILMLDSALQDPDVWGDPDNFRPDRFLDDTGKIIKKEFSLDDDQLNDTGGRVWCLPGWFTTAFKNADCYHYCTCGFGNNSQTVTGVHDDDWNCLPFCKNPREGTSWWQIIMILGTCMRNTRIQKNLWSSCY